jgi:serine protease Do
VTLLGVFALMILVAPAVKGQTVSPRPYFDLRAQILGGSTIGVTIRDVDDADLKREKLPALAGAVVEDVATDSPAAKAGIKAGDVIISFDTERVRSARHLARLIEETADGREIDATVVRAGEKVSLKMTPVERSAFRNVPFRIDRFAQSVPRRYEFTVPAPHVELPRLQPFAGSGFGRFFERRFGFNGVTVQDLTGQLGDYFGTKDGVLVTSIDDGSAAKALGLKAGDVITKINEHPIRSSADWWRRMMTEPGEVTLTILRDRKELTLKGKIE